MIEIDAAVHRSHPLRISEVGAGWSCPLCGASGMHRLEDVASRRYALCEECTLISLDPRQRLEPLAEVMRYNEHENSADDERYAAFLSRLGHPMQLRLTTGSKGLDFGCGPTPLLASIMSRAGFPTAAYDPFFQPDSQLLEQDYDFVACSEVVEHLHDPAGSFELFARLLRPGGLLGVMTRFYGHEAAFERWWYTRDPTHVCFYAESTMQWIAERHGWTLTIPAPHVSLFRVPHA